VKLTADLRGITDDGRRWWAVVGACFDSPWLIEARSGREAAAEMKREMFSVETRANGMSHRDAREWIRIQDIHCAGGPYTTAEAFVIDAGWLLAHRATEAVKGCGMLEPTGPIVDLDQCWPWLTDEQVATVIDAAARHYR
jgi:hypothetical protein